MAQVKPDDIIDELSSEFRTALEESVREVIPNVNFDAHELFHAFQTAVKRKCGGWRHVSDHCVETS